MQVKVPVADLRRKPIPSERRYFQDPLQETQLLYGETVILKDDKGDWAFVEATEQPKWLGDKWGGYPGWILKSALTTPFRERADYYVCLPWVEVVVEGGDPFKVSLGTSFHAIGDTGENIQVSLSSGGIGYIKKSSIVSQSLDLLNLLETGKALIGTPYHWGGRSAYFKGSMPLTSLDCSGLVQLLYRIYGVLLPRDAKDQILQTEPCQEHELLIGDPIFSLTDNKIDHVMLYAGKGMVLESSMSGGGVCLASLDEKRPFLSTKFLTKNSNSYRIT